MEWIDIKDELPPKGKNIRILIYSAGQDNITMRYRIIDADFIQTCKDTTHWAKLWPPMKKTRD